MTKKEETVWKKLAAIDCNSFVETKGNLTYLSWSHAWELIMDHYPKATYKFKEWDNYDVLYYKNGTGSVACEVTIDGVTREMWLAIMDHRNQAVSNPSSTQISNTKMRCLTKCLAMFGLGHYIYAGEDVPRDSEAVTSFKNFKDDEERAAKLLKAIGSASQVAKLKTVWGNGNGKWVEKLEKDNPDLYFKIYTAYQYKQEKLLEGVETKTG